MNLKKFNGKIARFSIENAQHSVTGKGRILTKSFNVIVKMFYNQYDFEMTLCGFFSIGDVVMCICQPSNTHAKMFFEEHKIVNYNENIFPSFCTSYTNLTFDDVIYNICISLETIVINKHSEINMQYKVNKYLPVNPSKKEYFKGAVIRIEELGNEKNRRHTIYRKTYEELYDNLLEIKSAILKIFNPAIHQIKILVPIEIMKFQNEARICSDFYDVILQLGLVEREEYLDYYHDVYRRSAEILNSERAEFIERGLILLMDNRSFQLQDIRAINDGEIITQYETLKDVNYHDIEYVKTEWLKSKKISE